MFIILYLSLSALPQKTLGTFTISLQGPSVLADYGEQGKVKEANGGKNVWGDLSFPVTGVSLHVSLLYLYKGRKGVLCFLDNINQNYA